MTDLRDNIYSQLKLRDWSYYDLASASDVPPPTIFRFLKGTHKSLRDDVVKKLAKGFGISEGKLRGLESNSTQVNSTQKLSDFHNKEKQAIRLIKTITEQLLDDWLENGDKQGLRLINAIADSLLNDNNTLKIEKVLNQLNTKTTTEREREREQKPRQRRS